MRQRLTEHPAPGQRPGLESGPAEERVPVILLHASGSFFSPVIVVGFDFLTFLEKYVEGYRNIINTKSKISIGLRQKKIEKNEY